MNIREMDTYSGSKTTAEQLAVSEVSSRSTRARNRGGGQQQTAQKSQVLTKLPPQFHGCGHPTPLSNKACRV